VLNAGSGKEISMGMLAGEIAALMGREVTFRSDPARHRPAKSEVMRLVCDSTKLRRRTGWQPRHALRDGLKITIEWFLDAANLSRYRTTDYIV
jgi:nucleoside-diphosphate-sugar epimerase